MFHISYIQDKDKLSIKLLESESYESVNDFFKTISINYDKNYHSFICPANRLHEVILWLARKNWPYTIDPILTDFIQNPPWYKTETKLYRGEFFNTNLLNPNIKLADYQKEDLDWMVRRNRIGNFNDAGLGKSCEAVLWLAHHFEKGNIDGVILTVPPGLAYHWIHEFKEFTHYFQDDDFFVVDNSTKFNLYDNKNIKNKKIVIIPDHLFAITLASYKPDYVKNQSLKRIRWKKYVSFIEKWGKQKLSLVIDEAHRFNNEDSIKVKSLLSHIDEFEFRLIMTATPAISKFEKIHTLFNIIDPGIFPACKGAFVLTIGNSIGNSFDPYHIKKSDIPGESAYKIEAVEYVKKKAKSNIIQRMKDDLPEMKYKRHIKPVYFRMGILQQTIYNEIQNYYLALNEHNFRKGNTNIVNDYPYLMMTIDNPLTLNNIKDIDLKTKLQKLLSKWKDFHDEKLVYTDNYLHDWIVENNEKVIIYDTHPVTIDYLAERYKKYNPLTIHGQQNDVRDKEKYRHGVRDKFNDLNSDCKLIILSSQAASAGINLNKGGNRILVFTQDNNTTNMRQLYDRTHRINSERDSYIEILVMDKTLDNIRLNLNLGRIELNDVMFKDISRQRLIALFNGITK